MEATARVAGGRAARPEGSVRSIVLAPGKGAVHETPEADCRGRSALRTGG